MIRLPLEDFSVLVLLTAHFILHLQSAQLRKDVLAAEQQLPVAVQMNAV